MDPNYRAYNVNFRVLFLLSSVAKFVLPSQTLPWQVRLLLIIRTPSTRTPTEFTGFHSACEQVISWISTPEAAYQSAAAPGNFPMCWSPTWFSIPRLQNWQMTLLSKRDSIWVLNMPIVELPKKSKHYRGNKMFPVQGGLADTHRLREVSLGPMQAAIPALGFDHGA